MMNNMMFNYNQMGMNFQQNQMNGMMMDETTQNIRNIIQNYENKIRELEEIIKQKDYEIIFLKHKLNNNISNINNINPMMINMNMNMNPSNLIMSNMNQLMRDKGKEIYLTIISENRSELIKCFEHDKASILKEKCKFEGYLTFNYKEILSDFTIKENGICDHSLIYVKHKFKNIIFKNSIGITKVFPLSEDCPIGIAFIHYFMRLGRINQFKTIFDGSKPELYFLYNYNILQIYKTPIKEIFNDYNPIVMVKE